ncbi:MAG: polysaccharide biosynthesis tyrosine autokinase [Rhodospirillaceae bacterium]
MPKAHLTDTSIKSLKPQAIQVTYWDTALPSFGCRVSPGGTKTFTVMYGENRKRVTIGRYPTLTLAEARAKAREMLAEVALGRHGATIAFAAAVDLFINTHVAVNNSATLAREMQDLLGRHFVDKLGRRPAEEITTDDVAGVIQGLLDQPAECDKAFRAIRSFFRWAHRRKYVEHNPCDGMQHPTKPVPRIAVPGEPEPPPAPALPRIEPRPAAAEPDLTLYDLFHRLWRRRATVAAVVALVMIPVAAWLWMATPRNTGQALVLLDQRAPRISDLDTAAPPTSPGDTQSLLSEVEIMRAAPVVTAVVDRLGLDRMAEFNPALRPKGWIEQARDEAIGALPMIENEDLAHFAAGLLTRTPLAAEQQRGLERVQVFQAVNRRLNVALRGQSRVVAVEFSAADPKLAHDGANAVADAYIEVQLAAKYDQTQRLAEWLEERIAGLRERVEESERAVEEFRARSGLIEGRGGTLMSQEVADLNAKLVDARATRAEVESRYSQMRRQLGEPRGYESVPEVLSSPLIQRLREQQIAIDRQLADLGQTLGDRHPRMQSLRADLRDLETQIGTEIRRIVRSVEASLNAARSHEATLRASLDQAKGQAAESNKAEIELRALEREARTNRTLLEAFLARFKAAGGDTDAAFRQADARVISRGEMPTVPSSPQTVPILAVALVAALILGVMIAFLREQMDRGFHSAEEIEAATGLPSLGLVPFVRRRERRGRSPARLLVDRPGSAYAESVRSVYAGVTLGNPGAATRMLLITSAQAHEGKTTLALSVARMRAAAQQKVVIVDADLRAPGVHPAFALPRGPGLAEVLAGEATLDEALRADDQTGLAVLTAGRARPNPSDLIESEAMRTLLDTLRSRYDLVVVDSPPVRAAADARFLASLTDTTLFVVRWGRTRREVALQALRTVGATAPALHTVISMVDVKKNAGYGFGDSGYYYGRDYKYYAR